MKRLLAAALCAAMLLPGAALADPVVSAGGYTAYLGESNNLYLLEPEGSTKVLRYPMSDIIAVTQENVIALSQDNKLLSVRLDGAQTVVLTEAPQPADLAAHLQPRFEMTANVIGGNATGTSTLSAVRPDGNLVLISTITLAAAANDTTLFFIEQGLNGTTTLRSLDLTLITDVTTIAPVSSVLGVGVADPLGMTAAAGYVTMVAGDHSVTVLNLADNTRTDFPALSEDTVNAAHISSVLHRYTQNAETGAWLTEATESLPALAVTEDRMATVAVTAPTTAPTATPAPTQRPTTAPTKRPTATPDSDDPYPRLEYGDTGSDVRKMQKRLKELGYPVGKVDGSWGKNTQLAVNLFQCAVGYSERSYATSGLQERLYSRKAPKYDPYAPLKEGDRGTDVKLMQKALFDLGYLGTDEEEEVDSIYGAITTAAVMAFQKAVGEDVLKPTGEADADTLFILFSDNPPRNPALPDLPTDPNYPELITPAPKPPVEGDDSADPIVPDEPEAVEPIVPEEPETVEPIVPDEPETVEPIVPEENEQEDDLVTLITPGNR